MAAVETRREAVVKAAQELVLKHGLRGTSMEAVARAAGVAKPTLYAYFPDKSAVFAALFERLIGTWRAEFLAGLSGSGDVVERIGTALSNKHKAAMRLLAHSPHAAELSGEHHRMAVPQFAAFEAEVATRIEAELGRAGAARPRLATQLLLAAAFGISRKAQSTAELGPALRLLTERLLRPELPG